MDKNEKNEFELLLESLDISNSDTASELEPPKTYGNEAVSVSAPSEKKERKKLDFKEFKPIVIVAGVILIAVALIFGGIKLIGGSKSAYLKPYEKKYGIEYPDGILEEFCDAYAKEQNLSGKLTITDTSTQTLVSSANKSGYSKLQKGSSVYSDMHFISISVDNADIESVYSKPEGFLNASQSVTFTSLFEEKEYRVIAAFYTNSKFEDDNGYRFPYNLYGNLTEKSFTTFQDKIETRRLYDTGYKFNYDDYFLTVSADSDFMPDYKFVLVCASNGKGVKKSKKAVKNEKIHFPQSYYDNKKEHNTFYFTGKWYPEIYTNEERTETKKLTLADFE